MRFWQQLKSCWPAVLDYVLPRECLGCDREGEFLCSACFSKIELFSFLSCFLCNQENHSGGICPACRASSGIDEIIVAARYGDSLAGQLVEQFKYQYLESLGESLARLLTKQIARLGKTPHMAGAVLVPIPLHAKRLAERGYNQATVIAFDVARAFGCQVRENLLKRIKYTRQQAKLLRGERLENIKEAFALNPGEAIQATVVLVDDVLTTGATFCEAARVLKKGGVKKVICVAVCHG